MKWNITMDKDTRTRLVGEALTSAMKQSAEIARNGPHALQLAQAIPSVTFEIRLTGEQVIALAEAAGGGRT